MDIKAILTEHGVAVETIGKLSKAIEKAVGDEFVDKQRYKDKLTDIESLKIDLKTAEDNATTSETYKKKWEDEIESHKQTKTAVETEKVLAGKTSALHKQLAADGANPRLLKLLEKEFDLAKLEIDGEGDAAKIKGWETLSKSVKEQYADVFGKVETTGAGVANPPPGKEQKPATNKDMNSFIRGTL